MKATDLKTHSEFKQIYSNTILPILNTHCTLQYSTPHNLAIVYGQKSICSSTPQPQKSLNYVNEFELSGKAIRTSLVFPSIK